VAVVAILVAPPARAIQPDADLEALEIRLPDYGSDLAPQHSAARTLSSAAAAEIGGHWEVYRWSPASETAAWVYGSGAALPGSSAGSDAALEQAARSFITAHPAFFHAQEKDLVLDAIGRGAGKVGIHFRQLYRGIPVMNSRVSLVITDSGTIVAFGSEFYSNMDVDTTPALTAGAAITTAQNSLTFDPATDQVDGAPELVIVPVQRFEGGATMRLAWNVRMTTQEPYGIWASFVDAKAGEIFWRLNDVESLYTGTSKGDVEKIGYCNGVTPNTPFREMTVSIAGVGSAPTDSTGAFTINQSAGNQSATAEFDGTQANCNRQDGPDATQTLPIQENVPLDFSWTNTNSHVAERDAYFWMNETYAYIQDIDPTWSYQKITINVNVNATCNANFGGSVMNLFREGGGCGNTGRIGDVVAHEFGHGIQASLLGGQGEQGLGEGNADIAGTFMSNESLLARGFFLNQCSSSLRNCENNLVYPTHVVGQPIHDAGRVICGFNWDMRQELEASLGAVQGKAIAARTWHFARKVFRPMEQPDQVLAYFVIDDDDANMINGTPHYDEICVGAENHGFECPLVIPVYIVHTPLEDTQDSQNPYPVVAQIFAFDGDLAPDSTRVHYKTNFGAFQSLVMTPTANPDEFSASIPAQPTGTLIQYYISAADDLGQRNTVPANGPGATYGFYIGTLDAAADHNMETDPGWALGTTTATRGAWERADPVGVVVFVQGVPHQLQPADDHTPDPGVLCWLTQNGPGAGQTDVTGGFTTLNTAIYDLAGEQYARLTYWLFYSNHLGNNPSEDAFDIDVSTNGGTTWTNIESRLANTSDVWQRQRFELRNFTPLTSNMRFRFTARDVLGPSLVEAAIDDFKIETVPGTQGVEDPEGVLPRPFVVDQNVPNPFNPSTEIHYSLPFEMLMSLKIYDVEGRMIRTLADGTMTAGDHVATWDGRDSSGGMVASGIYYYRLESPEYGATRKMVLMK
jgi:Zn-dependent metalloprotease